MRASWLRAVQLSALLLYITKSVACLNTVVVGEDMVTVREGENVNISCNSTGTPKPSITWTLDDKDSRFNATTLQDDSEGSVVSTLQIVGAEFPTDSGVYQCSANNSMEASANTSSVNITVQVLVPAVLTDPSSDVFLESDEGKMVTLSCTARGVPQPSIIWSPANSSITEAQLTDSEGLFFVTSNLTIASITRADTMYTCTTNNTESSQNRSFTFTVSFPPSITDSPLSLVQLLSPAALSLTCSADGLPLPTISWIITLSDGSETVFSMTGTTESGRNITISINSMESTITIGSTLALDTANYSCVANNTLGTSNSTVSSVFVFEAPAISFPVNSQQFTTNEQTNITFNCTASGSPAPSISFSYEGQILNSTEGMPSSGGPLMNRVQLGNEEMSLVTSTGLYIVTRTLTLFNAVDGDTGNFSCSASANITGSGTMSDTVTFSLTVFVPPSITASPLSLVQLLSPAALSLTCSADGLPLPTISWIITLSDGSETVFSMTGTTESGRNITISTNSMESTITIGSTLALDTANYSCVANNTLGTSNSTVSSVFVFEAPAISFPVDSQQFTTNEQTNITFNCTASGSPAPSISFSYEGQILNSTEGMPSSGGPLMNRVQLGNEEMSLVTSTGLYIVTRTLTLFNAVDGDTGNFSCSASANITGSGTMSDTVTFSLTVFVPPSITASPLSLVQLLSPAALSLTCSADGLPLPTISWIITLSDGSETVFSMTGTTESGRNITISTNSMESTITIGSTLALDTANYSCVANNTLGTSNSTVSSVFVFEAPDISFPVDSQQFTINEQTNITFNCTASGSPAPSISFSYEGQILNSTEGMPSSGGPLMNRVQLGNEEMSLVTSTGLYIVTRTLTLFNAVDGDTGNFSCSASANITGSGTMSDTVTFSLTVFVAANITELPVNQTVTSPNIATFSCTASGLPRPNITWSSPDGATLVSGVNDTNITEDTSRGERLLVSTLNITMTSLYSSGEYSCNADNGVFGSGNRSTSATASLTVYVNPNITTFLPGGDVRYVVNATDGVTFQCTATGVPPPFIQWFRGDTYLNSSSDQRITLSIRIISAPLRALGMAMRTLTINGTTIDDAATNYSCRASNVASGGTVSEMFELFVQVPPVVVPQDQRITANTEDSAILIFIIDNAVPAVQTSDLRWYYTANASSGIPEFGSAEFQEITNLTNRTSTSMLTFSNDSLTLTISNVVQTIGDVRETDQGRYFLEATNPAGVSSNYIDLVVNGPPQIVGGPQDVFVINGSGDAVFSCEAIAFPDHNVSWSYTNSTGYIFDPIITTADNDTDKYLIDRDGNGMLFGRLTVSDVTYEDRGTYTCTAANSVGMVSSSGNLTVHVTPVVVNISHPSATLLNRSVAIFCQASGFPIPNITWQKNGTDITTTNTSRLNIFSFSPLLTPTCIDGNVTNDFEGSGFEGSISELIRMNGLDVDTFISSDELRVVGVLYFEGVAREDTDTYTCTATNGFPLTSTNTSVSGPVTLIVLERPDAPVNITATAAGPLSISLTWTSAFVGNSPVINFTIDIRNINTSSNFTQVASPSVSEVELTMGGSYTVNVSDGGGLVLPFTRYSLRVMSCNVIGCSDESQESEPVQTDQDSSTPPLGVSVSATSTTTLTVVGMPPQTSNGIITQYRVSYNGSKEYEASFSDTNLVSFNFSETGIASGIRWQVVLESLTPGTTYSIRVAAVNGAVENNGVGMFSNLAMGITQPSAPPPPPQPPTVVAVPLSSDPRTYTLQLTVFSERNGRISHFHVVVVLIPLGQTISDLRNPDERYKSINDFDVYNDNFCNEQQHTPRAYITSEFGRNLLPPESFVIGMESPGKNSPNDRQSDYRNAPLCHDAVYTFFIRAYPEANSASVSRRSVRQTSTRQYTLFTSTGYYTPTTIGPAPRSNVTGPAVAVVIVLLLVVIAVVVAIVLVIVLRRRFAGRGKPDYEMNEFKQNGGDSAVILMNHTPTDIGSDIRYPVLLSSLSAHIDCMHLNENCGFVEEYRIIQEKSPRKSIVACMQPDNKPRNRYANIQSFDETRVTLKPEEGSEHDYINANFIDGYNRPREYIAAQGPLPGTLVDFWRMVWEYDSPTIIMLTNLNEKMKVKCSQYWPNVGSTSYANYNVTLINTITLADFVIRHFHVTNTHTGKMKEVRQFHFISWPDFGVPRHATPLLYFLRRIRNTHKYSDTRPMIVHCSAGVGRTGTLITIDTELQRAEEDSCVDPFNFVHQLRQQRNHMVQTDAQYIFLHDAIFEGALSGKTEVSVGHLHQHMQELEEVDKEDENGFKKEFRLLRQFKVNVREFSDANDDHNQFKNRVTNALPYNYNRVQLQMQPGVGGSDYINASFIDGYANKDEYIATQGPLSNTVDDFWRMIWERSVGIIVMLTQLDEKGKNQCAQYWPSSADAPKKSGMLNVELIEQKSYDDYLTRDIRLTEVDSENSHTVRQFHFTAWPEHGSPTSGVGMVDLIDQVTRRQQQSGNKPIVVHCSAGIGRTGAFCSLSTAIERVKAEGIVDVFHTVKHLRTQRPHMVQSEDQYTFCYHAIHEYVESFSNYSNFQ